MKVKPRRIHIHEFDIIAKHYRKKYVKRTNVRGGLEVLLYLNPGDELLIIRYAKTWWRYLHRRLEFDIEGRLRVSYFSDRDHAQQQSVWL